MKHLKLSHDRLLEVLTYLPQDGVFVWSLGARKAFRGSRAGYLRPKGYREISIDGTTHLAHRLAWFYVHGEWPRDEIDHIDQNRDNNRIENLRQATHSQNMQNTPKRVRAGAKQSKFVGVTWSDRRRMWRADITVNRKQYHLGFFRREEDAASAYQREKAIRHQFHPTAVSLEAA